MKYMLLIHNSEEALNALGDGELKQMMSDFRRFSEEIQTSGHYRAGSQLAPTSLATTVRVRNGKRLVTDGPFAETREQLGGYYLIEAADLDEAIGLAERVPSAKIGTIEIRPLVETATAVAAQ
jgi:hypothetical protein